MLRTHALQALACAAIEEKLQMVERTPLDESIDVNAQLSAPGPLPGREEKPLLVPPSQLEKRSMNTPTGRTIMLHAIAHIEFNAINLALDIVWRFAGLPEKFYRDWFRIAKEEVLHFRLIHEHLQTLGFQYGDFPAHHGLWEMADKTQDDILARLALVPRTLEARGLDVNRPIYNKLVQAGDHVAGKILDVILRDEIGHVAAGNNWYHYICQARGLEPIHTYAQLATQYNAPKMRGPFNLDARRAAGFTEAELTELDMLGQSPYFRKYSILTKLSKKDY